MVTERRFAPHAGPLLELGLILLVASACSFHRVRINEHVLELDVSKIVPDQSDRQDVLLSLGLPPPEIPVEMGTRTGSGDYLRWGAFDSRCFTIGFDRTLLITPFRWCSQRRVREIGIEFDANGVVMRVTDSRMQNFWPPFQDEDSVPDPVTIDRVGKR